MSAAMQATGWTDAAVVRTQDASRTVRSLWLRPAISALPLGTGHWALGSLLRVHHQAQMPFGGFKRRGIGRYGGKAGVAEFTELRWITVQLAPRHFSF